MSDTAIWWTGAVVLTGGACLAVALVFAGLVLCARNIAAFYCKRAGYLVANLRGMADWDRAGRPVQKFTEGEGWKWVHTGARLYRGKSPQEETIPGG